MWRRQPPHPHRIARINSFLQEYISGMASSKSSIVSKSSRRIRQENQENMVAWRSAILSYALFYPAVEILSVAAIALIYWSGAIACLPAPSVLGVLTESRCSPHVFSAPSRTSARN